MADSKSIGTEQQREDLQNQPANNRFERKHLVDSTCRIGSRSRIEAVQQRRPVRRALILHTCHIFIDTLLVTTYITGHNDRNHAQSTISPKGEADMNAQDCLHTLRKIRDVSFATINEEGHPEIRIIDVMLVGEGKLYFCTSRGKDFHTQLMRDPHVAIVGMTKDWKMVRLSGTVERITDDPHAWIDRIFEENPSMNGVYPGKSRYVLDPFCIDNGCIEIFDLGVSPIYRETFSLGSTTTHVRGFRITDACIGCGKCAKNCPQHCIVPGKPFVIQQQHCLHCGLCYENCPASAIKKRS